MPARKTRKTQSPATRARRTRAKVAEPAALARLPKPIRGALAEARESSHEFALAGLGFASQLRKQGEARMAEMVAEGRRVEPRIKQAIEKWKKTVQSRVGAGKLDLSKLKMQRLDLAEVRRRFGVSAR
ncbi:MAG: hypothetical protein V9E93_14655 [Steroidobacteraceae bacterium]|nr:hypothetical protein [Steroidobacteraceae bacterium]MBP7012718.1 hypothetical protein [Steroidobacteraceae bacterium]